MSFASVLAFLAKGAAVWVIVGLLTTMAWICAIAWWHVLAVDDDVSRRRFRRMDKKMEALPVWIQAFAKGVQRATFAVGLSAQIGGIIADVLLFVVGWPWVVPIIAEILYEWRNE